CIQRGAGPDQVVTAPCDADLTQWAYFASTPRFSRGGGANHSLPRRASSASSTFTVNSWASASMVTASPSFYSARPPPPHASGSTCPTTNPCVPPEKRPSVISPTFSPSPC